MKHLMVLLIAGVTLNACSTLSQRVYSSIHTEDSANKVLALLGSPGEFGASGRIPGATAWYYVEGYQKCGFTIQDNIVKYFGCEDSGPTESQRVGAFFQGLGQGLSSGNQMNCTSNVSGSYITTNCR